MLKVAVKCGFDQSDKDRPDFLENLVTFISKKLQDKTTDIDESQAHYFIQSLNPNEIIQYTGKTGQFKRLYQSVDLKVHESLSCQINERTILQIGQTESRLLVKKDELDMFSVENIREDYR